MQPQPTGSVLTEGPHHQPSKLEVLRALLEQDVDGLVWSLGHLAHQRRDVKVSVHRTMHGHVNRDMGIRIPEDSSSNSDVVVALSTSPSNSSNKLPTIQFSSAEFHVRDEEDFVDLEIIRSGNKAGWSQVTLVTKDHSAKAGTYYVEMEDTIVFEPGVGSIIHQVELMGVTHWEALLDFKVELNPDSVVGARIGRQLNSCRVKIICNDTFPSVDLEEDLEEDPQLELRRNKIKFYIAFLQMLWSDPNIRKGTIKRCLEDQLHSINFIVLQYITVFSVNYVFQTPKHESADADADPDAEADPVGNPKHDEALSKEARIYWLHGLICIQVLCLGILHIMDFMRLTWPVGGPSRKMIQKALLRRFMYYDAESRRSINPSELVMAISRDAIGLCSGYSAAMKVVQGLGGIMAIFVFKISSPFMFGKPLRWIGFSPFLVFPVVLAVYMNCRSDYTTQCLEKKEVATNNIVSYCARAADCFPIVSDYKRRRSYIDGLDEHVGAWNGANKLYNKADLHNRYFPQWLVMICVCFWYFFYGREVIWGTLSLGFFLTDIKIIHRFGREFGNLYVLCMKIESTFPALCRITMLLNKPTDLENRLINEKDVLRRTRFLRKQMADGGEGALDRVPIFMRDLQFQVGIPFNFQGTIEIAQGTVVCFVGKHGAGKTVLLKMLGNALFPQISAGEMFVPAHLRSLHVSLEPCFFEGTLMENMCFGVEFPSDGTKDRVQSILRALHCEDCVDDGVESTDRKMWQSQLTVCERHSLNLARALIANPYLICIHKPTMAYGAKYSNMVMQILTTFVRNRGIEQGSVPVDSRRPRTVIFTSFQKSSTEYADKIFKISQDGVSEIKHEEVVDELS